MFYVCILGGSYQNLSFEEREHLRENLRTRIETHQVRFLEYVWVWDEKDRCLLVAGSYERLEDARQWIETLECMGFAIIVRTALPGEDQDETGIRRGWEG